MSLAWEASWGRGRPRRRRRLTLALSVGVHVAAALAAIAYSFWHVEEVTPRAVGVTFVSAASMPPPPPPPPPPPGGGAAAAKRHAVTRPKVEAQPKLTEPTPPTIVPPVLTPPVEAPKETPKEASKEAPTKDNGPAGAGSGVAGGVKGGVAGGVKGGVAGGVVGGTGTGPAAPTTPRMLPPQVGAHLKLSAPDPDFPTALARAGARYVVLAKICVNVTGAVYSVTLLKHAEPRLDDNVVTALKATRYRPWMVDGMAAPFCTTVQFEFKSD